MSAKFIADSSAHALSTEQKAALKDLIYGRYIARKLVAHERGIKSNIAWANSMLVCAIQQGDRIREATLRVCLDAFRELLLQAKFDIIQLGKMLLRSSSDFDKLPREVWLRALCVNESQWNTVDIEEFDTSEFEVIIRLDLENSATADDSYGSKPLQVCFYRAMSNAIKTNTTLGKFAHDCFNEETNGALGVWKEPTLLDRLGAKA